MLMMHGWGIIKTKFVIYGAHAHLVAAESLPEVRELRCESSGKRASFRDAAGGHLRLRSSRGDEEEEDTSLEGDESGESEQSVVYLRFPSFQLLQL